MPDGQPASRLARGAHDVNLACSDERLDNGLRLLIRPDNRVVITFVPDDESEGEVAA